MTWKKANTIGNYEINEEGVFRNANTQGIIKPFKHKSGYLYVTCQTKNERHNYRLHRLVAQAFIPNPDNLATVNHKDLNKENNHVSNLEWMSITDNNRHARVHLVFRKPDVPPEERKRRARFAAIANGRKVSVWKDGVFVATYESASEASRQTGVCRRSVQDRILGYLSIPVRGYEFKGAD